jgi:hypothetical protein
MKNRSESSRTDHWRSPLQPQMPASVPAGPQADSQVFPALIQLVSITKVWTCVVKFAKVQVSNFSTSAEAQVGVDLQGRPGHPAAT